MPRGPRHAPRFWPAARAIPCVGMLRRGPPAGLRDGRNRACYHRRCWRQAARRGASVGAARSAWPRVQGRGLHPREWRSAKPRPGVQPETGGERGMLGPGSATARGRESRRCASASRGAATHGASPPILGLAKLSFGGWRGAVPKWDMTSNPP